MRTYPLLLGGLSVLCSLAFMGTYNIGPMAETLSPSLVAQAQNSALQPCYANQEDALIPIGYKEWADLMIKTEGEQNFVPPIEQVIPTGRHAGQWVMPGCFAVENKYGEVTIWRAPLGTGETPPFWTPYQS